MVDDMRKKGPFVTTQWLGERLDDETVQVIDASWYLPTEKRDPRAEFRVAHIPGAIFFDIDAVADRSSGLPHMLLDEAAFGEAAGALGIDSETTLVVYDGSGLFSAPRVWWTFRLFGAREVFVLDGGFPQWKADGRPIESGTARREPTRFHAKRALQGIADLSDVRRALDKDARQVVDARPAARFAGGAPEPRPGVRAGHMPGSSNLPFTDLMAGTRLKSPDALRDAFAQAGVDVSRPVVTSCGSGVTAAILVLALETMGKHDVALYDGSWTEYGSRDDLPIATGPR